MKTLNYLAMIFALLLTACTKEADYVQKMLPKHGATNEFDLPVGVSVYNQRIIAENDSVMDVLLLSLQNKSFEELNAFENYIGIQSLRSVLGFDFYNDSITPIYSPELATIVNSEGLYQVGDSLFYVFKVDTLTKTHVLSPVKEDQVSFLLSGALSDDIFDVSNGEMEPKAGVNCGACIYPITGLVQFNQNNFTWRVLDKNGNEKDAYFYGRIHFDQIGRVKASSLRVTNKIKNNNLIFTIESGTITPQIGATEWNHYKKYCTITHSSSLTSALNVYMTSHTFYVGTKCVRGAHYMGYFTGYYKDLNAQLHSKSLPFYYRNEL